MNEYVRIVDGKRLIDYDQLPMSARINFLADMQGIGEEYAKTYPSASVEEAEAYADFVLDQIEGDCEAKFEEDTRAWARELIVQSILSIDKGDEL